MLLQAMSKEQETGGRDVTHRLIGHKHEPEVEDQNKKSDIRTREKDQVSQAGAKRFKFQES